MIHDTVLHLSLLPGSWAWSDLERLLIAGYFENAEQRITCESRPKEVISEFRLWDNWATKTFRVSAGRLETLIEMEHLDLSTWVWHPAEALSILPDVLILANLVMAMRNKAASWVADPSYLDPVTARAILETIVSIPAKRMELVRSYATEPEVPTDG